MDQKIMRGIILIVISAFGYALMPSLSSLSFDRGLTVSQVLFYRFGISAVLVWGMIFLKKIPYKMDVRQGLYILFIGFVGYTLCAKVLFMGYQYVSGSVATMILFTHPIFVVLGESALGRKWPSRNKVLAILLSLLGLLFILYEPNAHYSLYGVGLCFAASVSYAVYCLGLDAPKTRKLDSLVVTAYVVTLSAVYNLVECIQSGSSLIITDRLGLSYILILAIGATVIPAITFFSGLKIVGSGSATIISTVEPAFVYALEVVLLGQGIVGKNIFGGMIIAVGILLLNRSDD